MEEERLKRLKILIDEENFPYFSDEYLLERIGEIKKINIKEFEKKLIMLARELCLKKAGIEEIKLGDIVIPSPKEHFLRLTQKYREIQSKVVSRADE
jgi:hypothetical protein